MCKVRCVWYCFLSLIQAISTHLTEDALTILLSLARFAHCIKFCSPGINRCNSKLCCNSWSMFCVCRLNECRQWSVERMESETGGRHIACLQILHKNTSFWQLTCVPSVNFKKELNVLSWALIMELKRCSWLFPIWTCCLFSILQTSFKLIRLWCTVGKSLRSHSL